MMKLSSLRTLAALGAGALLLAACGGGGGGGSAPVVDPIGTSAQFAEIAGDANSCTVDRQKRFVRAYLNEVYLWYSEIPAVDPAPFTTATQIPDYFDAQLVTAKDRFRITGQPFSVALFTGKHVQSAAPGMQAAPGALLAAGSVSPVAPAVTTPGGRKVGYLQLRDHDEGAQDELIAAFLNLQTQGVNDLVLDLRDNTGGFVYVALSAASMISGPASNGQVFERLVFNNKVGELTVNHSGVVQFRDGDTGLPPGTPLPQLGLPRVFVLTNGNTCSASESIINGLRGVTLPGSQPFRVIRIGETTCGKPYGFTEKINCGWSYFAVEFQGFNAQGFGDYQNGIEPMCRMSAAVLPGNRGVAATDPLYAEALFYADNDACSANSTVTNVQSSAALLMGSVVRTQRTVTGARWLPPGLMPR